MNGMTRRSVAAVANKDYRGGAREAVREDKVEVGELTTRYLTAGEGQPLLLLHGVGDDASDWLWAMALLARNYRIYAPDLPGSGGSAKPPVDRYSTAFFGRFVGAFVDALGVDRATVVGNSLGGLAGLRFALAEPERVAALGLVDSAGLGRRVNPALRSLSLPGYGRLAVAWGKRRPGAAQRALGCIHAAHFGPFSTDKVEKGLQDTAGCGMTLRTGARLLLSLLSPQWRAPASTLSLVPVYL